VPWPRLYDGAQLGVPGVAQQGLALGATLAPPAWLGGREMSSCEPLLSRPRVPTAQATRPSRRFPGTGWYRRLARQTGKQRILHRLGRSFDVLEQVS
jgi:hypothetical protein